MEETIEFLNKNLPDYAAPIFIAELQKYVDQYGVLKQVPYSLSNKAQLSRVKLEQFLKVLVLLKIKHTESYFFWLAKLYFLFDLSQDWKNQKICGGSKVLQYKEQFICRLRPTVGYVLYLYNYYKKNKKDFEQMKKIISKNQSNFYHLFQKEKNSRFKFYEIQTKLNDFKNFKMKKTLQHFKQDLGTLVYFKRIDQQDTQERQKEMFSLFKDQQNYLKFKFKNIILKNQNTIQRDKIFEKEICNKNTAVLFKNKFCKPKIGFIQKFVDKNEPQRKFLLQLSAQKKQTKLHSARSQLLQDIQQDNTLIRQTSAQKFIKDSQKKVKQLKPKRLQVKKIIKQNQLQQYKQAQDDLKFSKLENQKENFQMSNNYNALNGLENPFKKKQNFLVEKNASKNIVQSKLFQLKLQTKNLEQKHSNIWSNFRSVGNLHLKDNIFIANNFPQTGLKLHSFNLTTKKRKRKRK